MAFLRLTSEVANVLGSVVVVAMFFSPARGPLEVAKRVEKQNEVVCPPDLTHGVWRVTDEVTHTERPNAIGTLESSKFHRQALGFSRYETLV